MGLEEEEKNNTIKDEITEDQEIIQEQEITEVPEIEESESEKPEIEDSEPEEPETNETELGEPEVTEDQEITKQAEITQEQEINEDQSDINEITPNITPESIQPEGILSDDELMEQELLEFADFDSLDDLSEDDLADMQQAISENLLAEDGQEIAEPEKPEFKPEIDEELEAKMQAELELKKVSRGIKEVSREDLIEYLGERRTKIVYHALWHLAFNVGEDFILSKQMLYEALKEVTSKNPVEPLEEHKFYFGLGFILRLKLGLEKIIKFKAGKLQIAINPKVLQEILLLIGDPISERPILTTKEKNKMFEDFLGDDFLDI